ncbi:MAG: M1 family metallopeptidase [Bacteroidota bacterium]
MKSALQLLIVLVGISFLHSCKAKTPNNKQKLESALDSSIDKHSYSNIEQISTKHLDLELDIHFDSKSIYGVARHEMINKGTDTAIFDIKNIDIQKVTIGKETEVETDFVIGNWDKDSILGRPLHVTIKNDTKYVNIYYKTTEESAALQWLDPEQTTGKKHPFLFTQGQAILTRTWIPIQDTPKNRITYSAKVKLPKELMPVMSATNPTKINDSGEYSFEMKQAIPCYLIALAAGNIEYKKLSENSGIYTEPELIKACHYEFEDLPKMIVAAENLYGKYRWEQYDVIVLPYAFPYGGMENPRLTFANPTLITGDRSLVSVIAHELAHSWSGNLVTNATWDDFWLNEGFTVYFENRIMENLQGKDVADILLIIEKQELDAELNEFSHGKHPEDTQLKLSLVGRDPDDGMTQVAYIKGALFLKTLENKVGRKKFDAFLKNYFSEFAFKSVTTEQFVEYLENHLLAPNKIAFNTHEWIYEQGMPSNCIKLVSQRFNDVKLLSKRFAAGENIFKKKIKYVKVPGKRKKMRVVEQLERSKYITQEWQQFIRQLPQDIGAEKMRELDANLDFKNWGNSEILAEWFVLGVENNYADVKPQMEKFLIKVGRRKYLTPIYKALAKNPANKAWAKQVYEKAKGNYHEISKATMEEILK